MRRHCTSARAPGWTRLVRLVVAALTAVVALIAATQPAMSTPLPRTAADNPYQRGPDPTISMIESNRGPFATASASVSPGNGFNGGMIYYPTDTSLGTWGALAIVPGYTALFANEEAWMGPRLASFGFVVIGIETLSRTDFDTARGTQLLAALDYLTQRSAVRDRVDPGRLAVMGHSMGGGGTLEAARSRPSLQAAVPLTGWNLTKNWSTLRVPTLVVGAQSDTVAPVASHSIPFYASLPSTLDRAYLELRGASHFAPNTSNTTIAKYTLSWLKRFIDNDTRYEQFLCPIPSTSLSISDYRGNCPHNG